MFIEPEGTRMVNINHPPPPGTMNCFQAFALNFTLHHYTTGAGEKVESWQETLGMLGKDKITVVPFPTQFAGWSVERWSEYKAWAGGYCSPRHMVPFDSETKVQSALDDVASNFRQALVQGGIRRGLRR
jgi:hypothetical protein